MGTTIAQKIIARAAGRGIVHPDEIVFASPDMILTIDRQFPKVVLDLERIGIRSLFDPGRHVVVIDHEVPAASVATASRYAQIRGMVARLEIKRFYDIGNHGISHQIVIDKGQVRPGQLIVSDDTHSPTLGAIGAFGMAGLSEMPYVFAKGKIWIKVPHTIRVEIEGELPAGTAVRDLAQHIISRIGPERADYRVLEFDGSTVRRMNLDQRMTLCNVSTEIGAKTAIINPDQVTHEYLAKSSIPSQEWPHSDSDAAYESIVRFDAASMAPMVAVPPDPDHVVPVDEVGNVEIHQAYVGSCAGGRLEDMRQAARILKGRKVHAGVRCIIVPSTQEMYLAASREGLLDTFIAAGAIVSVPTCAFCFGASAPLADGEVCIATSTRNDKGRMGSTRASVYLGSAATVAASAVTGRITDPRFFVQDDKGPQTT